MIVTKESVSQIGNRLVKIHYNNCVGPKTLVGTVVEFNEKELVLQAPELEPRNIKFGDIIHIDAPTRMFVHEL